ncbi:MAG: hypothetical protein PWR30_233 [Candidatus Woesearchaeota archaeon]|nr:hypothetical protein [Candidatus Woesearchaeota archaeon]
MKKFIPVMALLMCFVILTSASYAFTFDLTDATVVENELLEINLTEKVIELEDGFTCSFGIADNNLSVADVNQLLYGEIFKWTPSYEDSGEYNITFNATCNDTEVSDSITITVLDAFVITEAVVEVDGYDDYEDDDLDEGDSFDVHPGDNVELTLEVENNHPSLDFENVFFELIIKNFEDEGDDDLEIESNEVDIDSDDNEKLSVSFDVPYRIEDKDYEIKITIYGEDTEGDENIYETSYTLTVDKERYALLISSADVFPQRIYANEPSTINVFGVVENIGYKDIEDLIVKIQSPDTDAFSFIETDIKLDSDPYDEDSRYTIDKSFEITIDEPGTYDIVIQAEIPGRSDAMTYKTFELEVLERPEPEEPEEPEEPPEEEPEEDDVEIVIPPKETEDNKTTTEIIVRETPFTESAAFIGILTGITGLLVILLVLMIIMLLRK